MRPYWILTALALSAVAAFAQQPYSAPCLYGCAPYVPLLTTPELSLQQVSPNPVGASNATTGLFAGATNSTLSQIDGGSTSSVYTVPVWYQGGAPIVGPDVRMWPSPGLRPAHSMSMNEHAPEDKIRREESTAAWTYLGGREHTENLGRVAKGKKSDHVYTNDDVAHENDKNGEVKYDGKSEKI